MKNTIKKKPLHTSYLVAAIFLGISAIAPSGFVGFLWWANTTPIKDTAMGIAILITFNVLIWLSFLSLFVVALTVRNLLRSYKNVKATIAALPTQDTTPPMPPKEFFAAHREEFTALNELILTDSEQQRPLEQFSYMWSSSSRELGANTYFDWSVTLTEEQLRMLESLGSSCQYFNITLTFESIKYSFDKRDFVYVLQYSKSWDHLEHLDGKWYFHDND